MKAAEFYKVFVSEVENALNRVDFIAEQMQKVKAFHVGTDEEYLIILGNGYSKATGKSDYDAFDYRGYLYSWDREQFERVQI